MFAFPGGPLFKGMIHFVADAAGLFDGFAHGKDETGDGRLRPLGQMKTVDGVMADTVTAARFAEIGMTFAGVNEDDGHLGLMSIALPDHFGGGAELAGGPIDGRGGAKPAQLEFKNRGRMTVGKGDGIEFAEAVAAPEVVAQFRILVPQDAAVAEVKVAGEKGADAKLGGGADDGEGGRLDADLAGAFPFPAAADGETLGPAEVFAVIGMDKFRFAVIRCRGGGVGIQEVLLTAFWRPPRNRGRRCKGRGRGFRSKTILPRPRISGGRPRPAGRGRCR